MKVSTVSGLGAAAFLGLAACTTPSDSERAARLEERLAMAEEAGLVCTYEQIMGSLRRERVCRTPDDIERSRQEAFQVTDRYQRSTRGPGSD